MQEQNSPEIQAREIELVNTSELIPYAKNANQHPPEQIDRLVKLIKYQGFRNPLVVQKGTNQIIAGNGRWQAAKKMGLEKVPVTYQEFENEAQLYAYMVSDNAIAEWAELDLSAINIEMLDFGPDFDVENLGLKDFEVEPADKLDLVNGSGELDLASFDNFDHQCPKCGFEWNNDTTT